VCQSDKIKPAPLTNKLASAGEHLLRYACENGHAFYAPMNEAGSAEAGS